MLFASDEELLRQQQQAKRFPKGIELSPAEQLRVQIDDYREMREHRRWRDFAWLLFIAPLWAALLVYALQWVIGLLTAKPTTP